MSTIMETFVETTPAHRSIQLLGVAQQLGWMVSIQGPPGVGKTTAIEEYARRSQSSVWRFTASTATSAKGPLMRALAQTFAGTKDVHTFENTRSLTIAIRMSMGEHLPLLVIDETQNLRSDSFDELRSIHDATGCGIAFVGNHTFLDRHSRERVNLLVTPQFASRLAQTLELQPVKPDEAEAVARARGIPNAALAKRLALQAQGPAGLRVIDRAAQLAGSFAAGAVTTATHYEAALQFLS